MPFIPADYFVPAQTITVETEVKKSRFITWIAPALTRADAIAFIQSIRQKYPDATHHCTAFVAGSPQGGAAIAYDDDGEPSGTAGKPMLNVLMHKGIGEVVTVVVRYFGGIRLGTGGLVRAYSSAVQTACEQLTLQKRIALQEGIIRCDYSQEQSVRHYLERFSAKLIECHYGEQVMITVAVAGDHALQLSSQLLELTRGQVSISWKDDSL
ncbi:YigZ family protein [Thalassotalea sp. G20_0]|uniref:YigZ family protein n=1 Tax=Thalassotalea sp. G20_0 TaxID=2821093 RepID=UPI001ADCA71F|nr:YigZ family protein [Thalassotalea sp. G20_0]MBO9496418.1 YigZ family protein [Thalassotalea sp. G20_0]